MEAATIEMAVIPAGTAETKRELRIKEYHYKLWILIRDTTREERERIVGESIGNINGFCDGCAHGLAEMYQEYIDGKKEIRDIHIWNITVLFLCIGELHRNPVLFSYESYRSRKAGRITNPKGLKKAAGKKSVTVRFSKKK